jgi:transposase
MDLAGIGPCGAARLLVEGRRHHPVPEQGPLRVLERHRTHRRILRRSGPASAVASRQPADQPGPAHHGRVQIRNPSEGRDYYERKKTDGKSPMEAMRCVKRRLSDIVYQQMLHDAITHTLTQTPTGPGGNTETTLTPA